MPSSAILARRIRWFWRSYKEAREASRPTRGDSKQEYDRPWYPHSHTIISRPALCLWGLAIEIRCPLSRDPCAVLEDDSVGMLAKRFKGCSVST